MYIIFGLAAFWPSLPSQSDRMAQCACGDPALSTWFLAWVPFSILHGHNPLFTAWIDVPSGVNLAQNTEMPLLGLITSPITLLAGPISSYNLLLFAAFPLSATSMYFVLRRWTGSALAGFFGGLLYGFSTFSTGQGIDHPMFSFVPLPPLILFVVHQILVRKTEHPSRPGLALGALVIGQFFIEAEVLADLALVLGLGLLIVVVGRWRSITASMVAYSMKAFACAATVTAVIVAYPVWFMEFGPQHFTGTVQPASNPYSSDLLGPAIPTTLELLHPAIWSSLALNITHRGAVQNDSYIGLPLIVIAGILVFRFRRDRWMALSAALAAVSFVLSLGRTLVVDGHRTSVKLPFDLIAKLPLLGNILPVRISLFEAIFLSITVALGCGHLLRSNRARPSMGASDYAFRRSRRAITASVAVGAAITLTPIIPRWPYHTVPSAVPAFFTSSELRRIPRGSTVLTYPYPRYPNDQAMLWQAAAKMRFRITGAYALQKGASGHAALSPAFLVPRDVQEALDYAAVGAPGQTVPPTPLNGQLTKDVQHLLRTYQVHTVIVDSVGTRPALAIQLFTLALGPPQDVGGVSVWFNVEQPHATSNAIPERSPTGAGGGS